MKELLEQLLKVIEEKNGGIIMWVGRPPTIHTHYAPKPEQPKVEQPKPEPDRLYSDAEYRQRVIAYLANNPGHSREDVARNTKASGERVRLAVHQLIVDGDIEEVFKPREPGQRGPVPIGLRLTQ